MSSSRLPVGLTCAFVVSALAQAGWADANALAVFSPPTHEFSVMLPANVIGVPSDDLHSGIEYSATAGAHAYSVSSTKLFNDSGNVDHFTQEALKRLAATPTLTTDAAGKGWNGKAFNLHIDNSDVTYVVAAAERGDKDGKVVYEFMAPTPLEAPEGKNFVKSIVIFPEEAIHAHLRDLRPGMARWQQVNFWVELMVSASLCMLGLWFGFVRLSRKTGKAVATLGG
jgi:hypothetical protein